ncbi:MAG TPA: hypothetical protein VNQ79_02175 [Blastocatellia bacterium]|nr:hypothetical protein [Blastocatellia bacterium]
MNLIGRQVQFSISDIHLPEPEEVLKLLYGKERLTGRVRELIESSHPDGRFVLVEVAGVGQVLILPLEKISPAFIQSVVA